MSTQNLNNTPTIEYESLCDLKFLGFWLQCDSNWSSMIKEEIQEAINLPSENKKFSCASQVVLFCILTTLVLLGAAWIHTPKTYQTTPEFSKISVP